MPKSKKIAKNTVYCVLESDDGGRIIDMESAPDYVKNDGITVHYAGDLGVAELVMKRIEEKQRISKCS